MAAPVCPPNYDCTFNADTSFTGPWWEGPWGIVVSIAVVVALACLLAWVAFMVAEYREGRDERRSRLLDSAAEREGLERNRAHQLARDEQLTMQMDAAKGNPEVLEWLRRQREVER